MLLNTKPLSFNNFIHPVHHYPLPKKFTYPFYYQPNKLAQIAASELQQYFESNAQLKYPKQGRMFGVLVVKTKNGELGYLAASSGTDAIFSPENNTDKSPSHLTLVPAIFTGFEHTSDFVQKQKIVNDINQELIDLVSSSEYAAISKLLAQESHIAKSEITAFQQKIMLKRQKRKQRRQTLTEAEINGTKCAHDIKQQSIQLSRESVQDKQALQRLKAQWQSKILDIQNKQQTFIDKIAQLKKTRRKMSAQLQRQLFKQYQLLNINGESVDLLSLFQETAFPTPPAGAGDCAAPKLLQYAFKNALTPIAMAEFWWGMSPRSEVRKHKLFYPACQGKCQPILTHMLSGMKVDENPLLVNPAANLDLEIVYQDEDIVVVNKPSGLLSVPGKSIKDSVYVRIQQQFPHATGPMIVHRLDMATSGLLILSLNERAHKGLQKQFINREISKYYVALIDGKVADSNGVITLPLRGDLNDRPRQLVCTDHGKPAKTEWLLLEQNEHTSRIQLSPITGRTHQLRVHCAHPDGLNMAIIGDDLYGSSARRLHLHAQQLSFSHPITKKRLNFNVAPDF